MHASDDKSAVVSMFVNGDNYSSFWRLYRVDYEERKRHGDGSCGEYNSVTCFVVVIELKKIELQVKKLIDDHTLVALTIMIAESRPEEKEMMISVIINCIK